jgi:hypothetical protein
VEFSGELKYFIFQVLGRDFENKNIFPSSDFEDELSIPLVEFNFCSFLVFFLPFSFDNFF